MLIAKTTLGSQDKESQSWDRPPFGLQSLQCPSPVVAASVLCHSLLHCSAGMGLIACSADDALW